MTYKGFEILAEVITESSIYTLDEDGNLNEHQRYIDLEPEITYYGIHDERTGYSEWFNTLDELKQFIDEEVSK